MKNLFKKFNIVIVLSVLFMFINCSKDDNNEIEELSKINIFSSVNDSTISMDGVISTRSLQDFNNISATHPKLKYINIKNCDGSIDDETNLVLSKKVHDLKINTHLKDNGSIASGGVDFFLAGIKRTKGSSTKIGVHSWASGDGKTAKDYPVGNSVHLPYIEYYVSIGFTQADAEAFYYFTINAASASEIHWMTDEEITKYKMIN